MVVELLPKLTLARRWAEESEARERSKSRKKRLSQIGHRKTALYFSFLSGYCIPPSPPSVPVAMMVLSNPSAPSSVADLDLK